MKIVFELWQLVSLLLTMLAMLIGMGRVLLSQIERRFDDRLGTLADEARGWRTVERELMALRAELPERYVRREDYVRGQSVLEAKLDAVASKLELVQLQGVRHDR